MRKSQPPRLARTSPLAPGFPNEHEHHCQGIQQQLSFGGVDLRPHLARFGEEVSLSGGGGEFAMRFTEQCGSEMSDAGWKQQATKVLSYFKKSACCRKAMGSAGCFPSVSGEPASVSDIHSFRANYLFHF